VIMQEGVYTLDSDEDVLHIVCDVDDLTSLEVLAINPKAVLQRLRDSKYIIGGQNWGCGHALHTNNTDSNYQGDAGLPIYRFIEETTYSADTETIHVKSHVIPMSHVLEKSSITLIIPPNYKPLEIDGDSYYETSESYDFNHNYDVATGRAISSVLPVTDTMTCEECFFHFNAGYEMKLDIDYGTFYWPYIDYLKVAVNGDVDASMYLRATNPPVGKSEDIEITDRTRSISFSFPIGVIVMNVGISFQLLTQIEVVESSLDFTLFTGLSASSTVEYGVEQATVDSDLEIIAENDWAFEGHPLSLQKSENNGKFNPRVVMIPRIFISPYSLVDLIVDIMPYVGVEIWDSSNPVTNPDPADAYFDTYNTAARPLKPESPPELMAITQPNAAKVKLLPPPSGALLVTDYEVRLVCSNCWDSYWADYVYLSSIGFFAEHYDTASQCFPDSGSSSYTAPQTEHTDFEGDLVTCADTCRFDTKCVSFSFLTLSSSDVCVIYWNMPSTSVTGGSGSCYSYDKIVQTDETGYFEIRDGDFLAYDVTEDSEADMMNFKLKDKYQYDVSYRGGNARGLSEHFSDSTRVQLEFTALVDVKDNMFSLGVDFSSNLPSGETIYLEIWEKDSYSFDDYVATLSFTTNSQSSRTINTAISLFYSNVFESEGSNDHRLYVVVKYNSLTWATTGYVDYNPISNVQFSSTNNNAFTFYGDPALFSKVRVYACYWSWYATCSYKEFTNVASYCTGTNGNDCTMAYGASGYNYFYMKVYDAAETSETFLSRRCAASARGCFCFS
jgi:hypothetical protein